MDTVASSAVGFAFGLALQKARVFDPTVIQSQLLLQDFTMMQTFLAALGTSQMMIGTAYLLPNLGAKIRAAKAATSQKKCDRGVVATTVGASILGVGMALAGACPGTIYAQVGSGIPGSVNVLSGAAVGVFIFSVIEKTLKKHLYPLKRPNTVCVEEDLNVQYPHLALIVGPALFATSVLFAKAFPNSPAPVSIGSGLLSAASWSPQLAGALIGFLQIPSLTLTGEPLGMSSSLVAALSLFSKPLVAIGLIPTDSELASCRNKQFKKTLYIVAAISGALTSAMLGSTYGTSTGLISDAPMPYVSTLFGGNGASQAFVGGILLWIGARIAGGCTSGHGISGFAFMKKLSVLAVPAMFGGGIIAMHLLKYVF